MELEIDVKNVALGLNPETYWDDPGYLVPEPECPSANWCTMARCVGYVHEKNKPEHKNWWLTYLDQASYRFMGKEPFSRIYSGWIATPVLVVHTEALKRNDTEIINKTRAWLKAFWSYLTLSAFPTHSIFKFIFPGKVWPGVTCTTVGARSWERAREGNGPPVGHPYHVDGWALNWILHRVLFGKNSADSNPPKDWDDYYPSILDALERNSPDGWHGLSQEDINNLRLVLSDPGNNKKAVEYAIGLISNFKPMAEFRFYRFSNGSATIMPTFGVSNATAPLYGFATDSSGNISVLSCDPGARPTAGWPGAVSPGVVTIDLLGRKATVKRVNGDKLDILAIPEMPLPSGELIYEIHVGNPNSAKLVTFNGQNISNPTVPVNPQPGNNNPPVNQGNDDFFISQVGNSKIIFNKFNLHPKNVMNLGDNLRNIQTLAWEVVTRFMNKNTSDPVYSKVYIVLTGVFGIINMCGEALRTKNTSWIDNIRKGLRDISNQI